MLDIRSDDNDTINSGSYSHQTLELPSPSFSNRKSKVEFGTKNECFQIPHRKSPYQSIVPLSVNSPHDILSKLSRSPNHRVSNRLQIHLKVKLLIVSKVKK